MTTWSFQSCLKRQREHTTVNPAFSVLTSTALLPVHLQHALSTIKDTWKNWSNNRQLKQPRRPRQQKPPKFAYLAIKNSIFARFARAVFIYRHFVDVLVLSTTWNDLFSSCVDDVSIWWQMFNFVLLCPKRWFQFNFWIVATHFWSIMSLTNWKMIAEKRSHIFRWRSSFRRRRVCLSSLITK